jgi:hypothetical protein
MKDIITATFKFIYLLNDKIWMQWLEYETKAIKLSVNLIQLLLTLRNELQ